MDLFERDHESLTLNNLLLDCHNGNGQIALLTAPTGSGKTALLREFSDSVRRDNCAVLNASCASAEQTVPLAALAQLFDSPSLSEQESQRAAELLRGEHGFAVEGTPDEARAQVMLGLVRIILDLSRSRTVVLCVDDVHHADPESLQYLLHIVRRLHSARVMVILTERPSYSGPQSALHTELLRQPNAHHLWLGAPLSVQGVTAMIAAATQDETAGDLGREYHALTGGNPALVQALLRDPARERGTPTADGPMPGSVFEETVVSCLAAEEPLLLNAARALALLGDSATPDVLSRLLDLQPKIISRALHALTIAGVLDEGHRFRHPATAAAVTGDMQPSERDSLHSKAARVLYDVSAPATAVARHLLGTGRAREPWMIETLMGAVDPLFHKDQFETARACLELAHRFSTDEQQRALIIIALTEVECRISPRMASRRVPQLMAALRDGHVSGRKALGLLESLLWHGQLKEFDDLPRLVGELTRGSEPGMDTESEIVRRMLSCTFPQLALETRDVLGERPERPLPASAFVINHRLRALYACETALSRGADPGALADARQILGGCSLSPATFRPLTMSLWTLLHADRLSEAEDWAARLLEESRSRGAADWQAAFAWTSACVALRLGNLRAAEEHARAALNRMPPEAWGVRIGGVYAVLVEIATRLGKYGDATAVLNRPVPEAMFGSPYGVDYLYARGRFCLTRGQYLAGLKDFVACKDLLTRWRQDRPFMVAWRSGAAEAWLHLGNNSKARQLVEEQLSLLPSQDSTLRGTSLHLLALTRPARERIHLLNESVEILRRLDRKPELAAALVDLGQAYEALGDGARQRVAVRQARHLTQECRTDGCQGTARLDVARETPSPQRIDGDGMGDADDAEGGDDDKLVYLSYAERRVSELAALGRTNREISSSLCITISTVEQHLTRVYRKLDIQRRQDLPAGLRTRAAATSEAERHGTRRAPLARKHA